jgi:hypothetical protein
MCTVAQHDHVTTPADFEAFALLAMACLPRVRAVRDQSTSES